MDGYDLSPRLFGSGPSPRTEMYYYHGEECYAVRSGAFKAHFQTKTSYVGQKHAEVHDPPLLYHLGHDPGEEYNVAAHHADVIERLRGLKKRHEESVEAVENQLIRR